MMCNSKDANLIADYGVDEAKRKPSRNETAFSVTPYYAKSRVLQKQAN